MRMIAILNRDGGTLKSLDIEAFCAQLKETLESAGHTVTCEPVAGDDLLEALDAAARADCDAVIIGGGDGTVSAAAARLQGTQKALGVLPAGTMNLFARSLGIPLQLDAAVAALAGAAVHDVDMASANGAPFVHQFSIGMHPKLIRLREKQNFVSRLGKIRATLQATFATLFRAPRLKLLLELESGTRELSTKSLGVTNNLFGEGHLPYAEKLDEGVLGIYWAQTSGRRDIVCFALNVALGRWRGNGHMEMVSARKATLRVVSRLSGLQYAMDGELGELSQVTEFRIHPATLKVLLPKKDD